MIHNISELGIENNLLKKLMCDEEYLKLHIHMIDYHILSLGVPPKTKFKAILTSHIVFISFLVNSIYSNS